MEATLEYPFISLQAWRLVNEVIYKINRRLNNPCLIEVCIRQAVTDNVAPAEIISTIKDMANDNHNAIADLIGNELTNKIKSF